MARCSYCGVEEGYRHIWNCRLVIDSLEPFFMRPVLCARCGIANPRLFKVAERDWADTIGKTYKTTDVLCFDCYKFIRWLRNFKESEFKWLTTT